jgi:very-short-patch-repair endonuclease
MPKLVSTKETLALVEALKMRGIDVMTEHWDGHKHVDIFIPSIKLYIEVDGIQHDISPKQITADLKRDHYSNKGAFYTKRFSNHAIISHLNSIADAIAKIVSEETGVEPRLNINS